MKPGTIDAGIIRQYRLGVLRAVLVRATGFDTEISDLVDELANELVISKGEAEALLSPTYRAVLDAIRSVRPT